MTINEIYLIVFLLIMILSYFAIVLFFKKSQNLDEKKYKEAELLKKDVLVKLQRLDYKGDKNVKN